MESQSYPAYEFPAPPSFTSPEGHEGGEPFDIVCTVQAKPDGKTLCLLKVGDKDTGYKKEGEEKGENMVKPDYSGMAKGMMAQSPPGASADY